MDPFFIVTILIGVILLGVIVKIMPFLLKALFWVLIVVLLLVLIFSISWNDVMGWASGISLW